MGDTSGAGLAVDAGGSVAQRARERSRAQPASPTTEPCWVQSVLIAGALLFLLAFLLLPLVLYRLFRSTHHTAAVLMVALALAGIPIALVSVSHRLDALALLTDARFSQAFAPAQLQALAALSLEAYGNGLLVTRLFWGLWLLPFGYLVLKSGFLPRLLGVLLMLGCLGYMVNVFGELLVPDYFDTWIADYAGLPAAAGEIGTCLWLLLVGARRSKGNDD